MTLTGRVANDGTTDNELARSRSRVAARGGVRLVAAGAVLAAVLAGCGSDSDDAAESSTTSTTTAATTVPSTSTSTSGGGYGGGGGTGGTEVSPTDAGETVEQGTLTIDDFAFSPANPTFRVGQTVVVTNDDTAAHTWTSTDGGFDTGLIQPGESKSVTLTKAGTFDFVCTPHAASMKGVVTVTA